MFVVHELKYLINMKQIAHLLLLISLILISIYLWINFTLTLTVASILLIIVMSFSSIYELIASIFHDKRN